MPPSLQPVQASIEPEPPLDFSSTFDDDASIIDIAAWAQSQQKSRKNAKASRKPVDGSFATLVCRHSSVFLIPTKLRQEHDAVLNAWAEDKPKFLFELVRLQGLRGADSNICPRCTPCPTTPEIYSTRPPSIAEYRCEDCVPCELLCRRCFLHVHGLHPFHRVQRYTGRDFVKTTLQEIGLVIQLGHSPHEQCPVPAIAPRNALVLHTNGHHPVNLLFCNCDKVHQSGDRVQQLLRAELYPATLTDPTTYCTFRMLEQFHVLTLQSKISAYDYYISLEKITDNSGLGRHYVGRNTPPL